MQSHIYKNIPVSFYFITILLEIKECFLGHPVLCYVTLRYVMSCYVMSCHVMSCYVMLCYVML
jgi:hypothetical protein